MSRFLLLVLLALANSCDFKFYNKWLLPECPLAVESWPINSITPQPQLMDMHQLNPSLFLSTNFLLSKQQSTDVAATIYELQGDQLNSLAVFNGFEHARHAVFLPTPWGDGILVADHGVDNPKENDGGLARLFIKNINGHWEDQTNKLPIKSNYNFHVAVVRTDSPFPSIYISAVTTQRSRPYLLAPSKKGYIDISHTLPEVLVERKVCFMTAKALDLNNDGRDEIVLGACDKIPTYNGSEEDRALEYQHGKWRWMAKDLIPPRYKDRDWGTVAMDFVDLNGDQQLDYVTAVHNSGFSEGRLQYSIRKGDKFGPGGVLDPFEFSPLPGFIPWVVTGDFDKDGKTDLLGVRRIIMPAGKAFPGNAAMVFMLLNRGDNHWQNVSGCFAETLGNPVTDVRVINTNEVIVFHHNGKVAGFRFKTK